MRPLHTCISTTVRETASVRDFVVKMDTLRVPRVPGRASLWKPTVSGLCVSDTYTCVQSAFIISHSHTSVMMSSDDSDVEQLATHVAPPPLNSLEVEGSRSGYPSSHPVPPPTSTRTR